MEAALCAQAGGGEACAAVLGGGVASLGAGAGTAPGATGEGSNGTTGRTAFAGLAEAEAVLTGKSRRAAGGAAWKLDDGLRRRWLDWLADSAASALPSLDEALRRLGWQAAGLTAMGNALRGLLAGEQARPRCSSIPGWRRRAVAARLAGRPRGLARLLEALPTPAAGERLRVAGAGYPRRALARPGHGLAVAPGAGTDPLRTQPRPPRRRRHPLAGTDRGAGAGRTLLPAETSVATSRSDQLRALHAHEASREGLALAAALLRPQGACRWWTCYASRHWRCSVRPCSTTGRLGLAELPSLLADLAAAGLAPRCLWRSERLALVEALAPGLGLDAAALQAAWSNACPRRCGPNACGACQACR